MSEPNGKIPWLKFLKKKRHKFLFKEAIVESICSPFVNFVFLTKNDGGEGGRLCVVGG